MEEINKKIQEKAQKMTQEQVGAIVLKNIELESTKQVLVDKINILNNEVNKLKEKYEVKDE